MRIQLDPEKKISLYNRDCDEMRSVLDKAMQNVMKVMLRKGLDSSAITLKINIDLNRDIVNDDNADLGTRPAIHPEMDYKITFVMQEKGSVDGDIIPKGSDELLVDDNGDVFLTSKEEASGQLSMFNSYDEYLDKHLEGVRK